jgi:hypothetical protein
VVGIEKIFRKRAEIPLVVGHRGLPGSDGIGADKAEHIFAHVVLLVAKGVNALAPRHDEHQVKIDAIGLNSILAFVAKIVAPMNLEVLNGATAAWYRRQAAPLSLKKKLVVGLA